MNQRQARSDVRIDFLPYTRWEAFNDQELDMLGRCIRFPWDDEGWHEAWLMLGQINVEIERRRL